MYWRLIMNKKFQVSISETIHVKESIFNIGSFYCLWRWFFLYEIIIQDLKIIFEKKGNIFTYLHCKTMKAPKLLLYWIMTNIFCCLQIGMITLLLGRQTRLTLWVQNHNKYLKINTWKKSVSCAWRSHKENCRWRIWWGGISFYLGLGWDLNGLEYNLYLLLPPEFCLLCKG